MLKRSERRESGSLSAHAQLCSRELPKVESILNECVQFQISTKRNQKLTMEQNFKTEPDTIHQGRNQSVFSRATNDPCRTDLGRLPVLYGV